MPQLRKCIIHIGYPRTATTWLQKEVFPRVQNYAFLGRSELLESLIHPTVMNFQSEHLQKLTEEKNTLLSEEMILGRFRAGGMNFLYLKEMAERIKASVDNYQVVLVIRRQEEMILSHYNLYVKMGGTHTLRKYLDQNTRLAQEFLISKDYFDYYKLILYLNKLFGKDRLWIYLYEKLLEDPQNFLLGLSKQLDLSIKTDEVNYNKINVGYTSHRLKIKRLLNHFTRYGIPFKHYFFHLPRTYDLFKPKNLNGAITLSDRQRELLREYCLPLKESNLWLTEFQGLEDIGNYGYLS